MRWGVLWLTAGLVTASCGEFLTQDLFITTEPSKVNDTNYPENRNDTANNQGSILTANSSASHRQLNSVTQSDGTINSLPEGEATESSRTRGLQSDVPTNAKNFAAENKNPVPQTEESQSGEKDSEHESSDESGEQSSDSSAGTDSNDEPNASNGDEVVPIIVHTTLGPVKGSTWKESEITAFIDIPYGMVRTPFEAPHEATPWKEYHEVEEHSKRCPQYQGDSYVGDLNCLTLSIFAPVDAENVGVFFYVHDSSFHSGDPLIYGPEHLVSKGVILVLPNYRIGALGFLCLQNETAPGNAGLKDLTKALQWIKNNIRAFGGNPSNIVVGGDGDAGALAGYLALSSRSKSYIQKVITESGSMLSHLALDRNPLNTAETLAKNIKNHHSKGVVYSNTFAEASTETIVKAAKGMRFCPCIEHDDKEMFMDVSPWTLLQNKEIDTIFMIGSASHAGTHEAVATTDSFIEQLNVDFGLILPEDLLFRNSDDRATYALRVKTQYFGNNTITRDQVEQLSLWSTDASYLGPLIRSARSLVDAGATVYLYEFDFVGDFNRELISLDKAVDGAVRSDIIGYLFTQDGQGPEEDTIEKRMTDLIVDLWISFINTGTPTADDIENWDKLKAADESDEIFLHITSDPKPVNGLYVDRLKLWTELYSEFFIERSFAISLTPSYYVFIAIIFCITTPN